MTIFLSGSIQPSNDIPIPNYRSIKEILYELFLLKFPISACISCSDIRTEKIIISKTFFVFPEILMFSVRKTD